MRPINHFPLFVVTLFLHLATAALARPDEKGQRVMTWIPPYAIQACKERLNESFGGFGAKDGITHLGLQFWQPTNEGGIKLVQRGQAINELVISDFRKWGETNEVRVMLCLYNATPSGWNWELARAGFKTHPKKLIKTLVDETVRLKLDGVDIDFEGKGNRDEDKEAFVLFIKELAFALKAKGKELTMDTFAYKWHVPNQRWWKDLLPHLDALHVMGYAETGAKSADWRSYDFLKKATGEHSSKLMIGVPSFQAKWQNLSALDHLAWVSNDSTVGLAIWDARLQDPAWRTKEIWQTLAKIKKPKPPSEDKKKDAPDRSQN